MCTALENFLKEAENFEIKLDLTAIAVGTDKEKYSPLLDGIKLLCKSDLMPMTLSRFLVQTGAKWTRDANTNWIADKIKVASINKAYVFHSSIVAALTSAAAVSKPPGTVTEATFNKGYRGKQNDTYKETIALLKGGFNTFDAIDKESGVLSR